MATINEGYYNFNDNLTFMAQVITESITFECDGETYPSMHWDDDTEILEFGATNVYDSSSGGWLDEKYKKIFIPSTQTISVTLETLISANSSYGYKLTNWVLGDITLVSNSVYKITNVMLPNVVEQGFSFLGWFYANNIQVQVNDVITEDTNIYAKLQEIYDVYFDSDGGGEIAPLIDVTTITSLPTPLKDGFRFDGWFYDLDYTQQANVDDSVTHNTTLYAKWTFLGSLFATFYNCNSENNRVDKSNFLNNATKVDIYIKSAMSIKNPIIDLYYNGTFNFNYCYIPKFNRYYFISDIVSERNDMWQILLNVDVLMSFKNQILQRQALISRQEFDYNDYLVDEKIPTQNNNNIQVIDITTNENINSTNVRINDLPIVVEIGGKYSS